MKAIRKKVQVSENHEHKVQEWLLLTTIRLLKANLTSGLGVFWLSFGHFCTGIEDITFLNCVYYILCVLHLQIHNLLQVRIIMFYCQSR